MAKSIALILRILSFLSKPPSIIAQRSSLVARHAIDYNCGKTLLVRSMHAVLAIEINENATIKRNAQKAVKI